MPFQSLIASHLFGRVYGPRDVERPLLQPLAEQAIRRIEYEGVGRNRGQCCRLFQDLTCTVHYVYVRNDLMYFHLF
jgi:hypothetical protein